MMGDTRAVIGIVINLTYFYQLLVRFVLESIAMKHISDYYSDRQIEEHMSY